MSSLIQSKVLCGIKVGLIKASYPSTCIAVNLQSLSVKSLLGNYEFKAEEIVQLQTQNHWIGSTCTITHTKREYPQLIKLLFIGNTGKKFLTEARKIGFYPRAEVRHIPLDQPPIALNLYNVLTYLLCLMKFRFLLNPLFFCILGLTLCYLLEKLEFLQEILLLPDRQYTEIQHLNRLAMILWAVYFTIIAVK